MSTPTGNMHWSAAAVVVLLPLLSLLTVALLQLFDT